MQNFSLARKILCLLCLSFWSRAGAQTTITSNTFVNNNGSGQVTFNFTNNSGGPVNITEIGSVCGANSTQTVQAWYNTTAITGAPAAITPANGWNQFGSGTITGISNATTATAQVFFPTATSTLTPLMVPDGATYGISVSSTNLRYSTLTAGTYTITAGGCSIVTGTNIGWGGTVAPSAPNLGPRGFLGYVTFSPAGPPCDTLLSLTASGITHESANLNWTLPSPTNANGFQYALTTSPVPPAAGTPIGGSSFSTGPTLTPATTYYSHLRSVCPPPGPGFSAWKTVSFTTLLNNGCFPPASLDVTALHPYGVVINWPPVAGASSYEWEVGLDPNPPAAISFSSAGTSLGKQNLSPNTTYYAHIRTRCGANRVSQTWTTISFTTPDGPPLKVDAVTGGFLQAYPNPAGGQLTLLSARTPAAGSRLVIRDMAGRTVAEQAIRQTETTVSLQGLVPGMYFLHYSDAAGSAVIRIRKQ